MLSSCSQTKYVPADSYLLSENEIIIKNDSTVAFSLLNKTGVTTDELNGVIKQQPNRKILIGKFHLWLYNRSNEERMERKIEKKQQKADKKNEKIKAKNERKSAKNPYYEPKQLVERKLTFGEKLRKAGEAPVILDSAKIDKTTKQMHLYLIKKGYFDNVVKDSVVLFDRKVDKKGNPVKVSKKDRQKAKVVYTVIPNEPYTINKYERVIADQNIVKVLKPLKVDSIIAAGQNFNTDRLEKERTRITKFLLEQGFYFFNKEFIYFKVDSTIGEKKVNITMGIQNFKYKDMVNDTMKDKPHQRFVIKEIRVFPDFHPKDDETTKYAKLTVDSIDFYHKYKMKIRPQLLASTILFKEGDLYRKSLIDATYKKFIGLGNFRAVNMKFIENEDEGTLIVLIRLEPSKAQTFTAATDGTHTNGLFGVEGSMTYTHSNVFGGAEKLQVSVAGGVEMQRLLTDSVSANVGSEVSSVEEIANTFNTLEFGPKVSLQIHRLLFVQTPLEKLLHKKLSNPNTEFSASLNFQRRPDFRRSIEEFSFGWVYHESPPFTWRVSPLIISAVSIDKSDAFQNIIDELNDRFLAASYQDHIIAGGKLSFVYNGQTDKKVKNTFYVRSTIETAGNILRAGYDLAGASYANDSLQSYNLLNIRFAQFVKMSVDLRYYFPVGKESKIVYRLAGGVGKPMANLKEALPFEKSFFAGGSNGIRAWKARTLGPGSYQDDELRYDKIGDIHLEGNVEARFPLISWVEGALFVDAGNIWLLNEDSLRVGGLFDKSKFISEIAFGGGLGLRFDLDFFVIRLDVAAPIKNPSLPGGSRWIWEGGLSEERKNFYKPQFNLGIGYPF
ncbi:Outer membrane protein assembly factor BamA [Parvicella tangerina]|uniref:Outer membrane protein assembly factor BamA n=1 Tax=Parvicella tangerina TaxID=2829795 RepID=A0A916JPA4_9FLAO|nr:Outer membrane protein assembly factor BamA [Parvicella tangerina]